MIHDPPHYSRGEIYVVRFGPGLDLRRSLQDFVARQQFSAGVLVTCVGSLTQYHLRFANQKSGKIQTGHFEIVSLVGTVSQTSVHLHLCIADEHGNTTGGHLLDGNLIYTTAEIALAKLPDLDFERVFDPKSGYQELRVTSRPPQEGTANTSTKN